MADKTLRYILEFDSSSGTASLKKFTDGVGETESRFGSLKSAIGALGIGYMAKQVVDFGVSSVKAFNESEAASAKLEAVIASTGGAAGLTKKEMDDLAQSLSMMSGVDDEVITGAETIIATFKNIKGDTFKEATAAALDMSTVMGTDASSAAAMLGKALNNPAEGLSALTRAGVSFTESEKNQITALVENGRALDAQTLILKKVEESFGGAAAAAGQTFGGEVNKLAVTLGDLQESMGGVLAGGIAPVVSGLMDLLTKGGASNTILTTLRETMIGASWAADLLSQFLNGLVGSVRLVINNAQALINLIAGGWMGVFELATLAAADLVDAFSALPVIGDSFKGLSGQIRGFAADIGEAAKVASDHALKSFTTGNEQIIFSTAEMAAASKKLFENMAAGFASGMKSQTTSHKNHVSTVGSGEELLTSKQKEEIAKRFALVQDYINQTAAMEADALAASLQSEGAALMERIKNHAATAEEIIAYETRMTDAINAQGQARLDAETENLSKALLAVGDNVEAITQLVEASNARRAVIEGETTGKIIAMQSDIKSAVEEANKKQNEFWDSFALNAQTAQELNQTAWTSIRDSIKDAISNANLSIQGMVDIFKSAIIEMAATAAANTITITIAASMGLTSISAGSAMASPTTGQQSGSTYIIPSSLSGWDSTLFGSTGQYATDPYSTGWFGAGGQASLTEGAAWPYLYSAGAGYVGSYGGQYVASALGGNQDLQQAGSMAGGAAAGFAVGGPVGGVIGAGIGYLSGPGFGGGVDNSPQEIYGINSILGNTASGLGDIGSLFASWKSEGNSEAAAFVLQSFDDINDRIIQTTDILPSLDSQWQALSNQFYDTGTTIATYGVNSDEATDATISLVGSVIDLADASAKAGGAESIYLQAAINTATSLAGTLTPATEAETQAMKGLATSAADYAIQAALAGNASSATTQQMVSLATALNQDTVETNYAISSFNSLITSLAAVDSRMAGLTNTSNALTLANNILGSSTLFDVETLQQASAAAEQLTGIQTRQQEIVDALANAHNMDAESVAALQAEYAGLNDQAAAIESSLSAMGGTMSDSASAGDAMSTAIDDASSSASDSVTKMQDAAGGFDTAGTSASIAAGYVSDLGDAINSLQSKTVTVSVDTSSPSPDGSHAGGLDYVPFDGYLAELHKGERVQTAQEAAIYRSTKTPSLVSSSSVSQTVNLGGVNITIHAAPGQSTKEIGDAVLNRIKEDSRRGKVILSPRGIGRSML